MSIRVDVQMGFTIVWPEGVIFSSMMMSFCTVWSMRNRGLAA